jgi:hypothetical protein
MVTVRNILAAVAATIFLTPHAAFADNYSFLRGSKWFVPPSTLPAAVMTLKDGKVQPVLDQTVWDITGYKDGYFWGRSIVQFMRPDTGAPVGSASCTRMMGSVAQSGKVLITFINDADKTTLQAVQGVGTLSRAAHNVPVFEMQMATGSTFVLAHWSYMFQCIPGQPCNARLPGTKLSLAKFIAQCD